MKKILYCRKRDGQIVMFEKIKIINAINKAFEATNEGNKLLAQRITETLMEDITRVHSEKTPTVEDIQDLVEDTLIDNNFKATAKAYIIYRNERNKRREKVV